MSAVIEPHPVGTPTPEWEDVRDYQPVVSMATVPVQIMNTAVVDERPAKRGTWRSFNVPVFNDPSNPQPIEVIPADPRIKNAWLWTDAGNPGHIYLGDNEQLTRINTGLTVDGATFGPGWSIGPVQGFEEATYSIATTSGGQANILNVRVEYWSD